MANLLCDFQETLWSGSTQFLVILDNLGNEPAALLKGQQVGTVEEDSVWVESGTQVLLCQASNQTERNNQLKEQLQFGAHYLILLMEFASFIDPNWLALLSVVRKVVW